MPPDIQRATNESMWQRDSSPHSILFIIVENGVKLKVLDWGGSGRPLIFLTGLGNNAHMFDKFAPKFVNGVHSSRIVRLAHANHFAFLSNEADVLREMNTFLRCLP